MEKSVWLIVDDKPGNANQAISIARAMGVDYQIKHLKYNFKRLCQKFLKSIGNG